MNSSAQISGRIIKASAWLAENPTRLGLVVTVLSAVATAAAVIAGLDPAHLAVAGPVPGTSGGSC